jgi:Zn-dependent protease
MAMDDQNQFYRPARARRDPRTVIYMRAPGSSGPTFSGRELLDLTLAVLVFSLIFGSSSIRTGLLKGWPVSLILYLAALLAVMLCILPHELAHKFVARHYGYWAEFRRSNYGLLIGLFFAFIGIPIITGPGAVMLDPYIDRNALGKSSAAGPASNAIIGFLFFPLALYTYATGNLIGFVLTQNVVIVSGMLGIFNMLPIDPFDGAKIWRWSSVAYIGLVACLGALLVLAQLNFDFLGLSA